MVTVLIQGSSKSQIFMSVCQVICSMPNSFLVLKYLRNIGEVFLIKLISWVPVIRFRKSPAEAVKLWGFSQKVKIGRESEQARKLGRCDSYLQNLKTLPTHSLTD